MKKFLLLFVTAIMFTSNAFAATYVLYYKSCAGCNWTKGSTYSDYSSCMNAVKYQYSWADDATCNSE